MGHHRLFAKLCDGETGQVLYTAANTLKEAWAVMWTQTERSQLMPGKLLVPEGDIMPNKVAVQKKPRPRFVGSVFRRDKIQNVS